MVDCCDIPMTISQGGLADRNAIAAIVVSGSGGAVEADIEVVAVKVKHIRSFIPICTSRVQLV